MYGMGPREAPGDALARTITSILKFRLHPPCVNHCLPPLSVMYTASFPSRPHFEEPES